MLIREVSMTGSRIVPMRIATIGLVAATACSMLCNAAALPSPTVDQAHTAKKTEMVVFAGGCFWGIQAVFDATKGVSSAISGYSGGSKDNAHYEIVSTGTTGHAESVQVTFDPSQISFGQLLQIYFSIHDPTQLNHQDPDDGTQYRSEIFYATDDQKRVAEAYIQQLTAAHAFPKRIVTKVAPLQAFYRAEDYHQDYVLHCRQGSPLCTNAPYVAHFDIPKLANFKQQFPQFVKGGK
jgi:peptide-methionine (S)-S-oxide reductase